MAKEEEEEVPLIEQFQFEEEIGEEYLASNFGAYVRTGFPKPHTRFRIVYESEKASIEETYFFVLNFCRQDQGFGNVIKTLDTFSASENSSFWGMTEQRKGLQQDRASQYLAVINKMIKELFQVIREIRLIKERMQLYDGATTGKQADDVALKSYWADMVEGGTKGQMNIYQMSQQVGFGTLPDLFFSTYIKPDGDVDSAVKNKAGEFNEKVKSVLRQKLSKYMAWRKQTESELRTRERFMIKHLRQYWASIRMYISWVKPYLRNVQKLQAPDKYDNNPDLISSFEGAMMEMEFVARKAAPKKGAPAPTLLCTFEYRVKPQMEFHEKGGYQHRGPVHVGRVELSVRSYGWTDDDVKTYIQYREQETLDLLGMMDDTLGAALDELGDELMQYLKEAGEDVEPLKKRAPKKDDEKPPRGPSIFEPFAALAGGFKDMIMMPTGPILDALIPSKESKSHWRGDKKIAAKTHGSCYLVYKIYKKAHKMVTW
ncbi:hypothetical protein GOV11_01995 [Candidatus Woesearchaeota archaeon]|nr:hypothetical protein [Candidatus Woesearchaeota archaeon]